LQFQFSNETYKRLKDVKAKSDAITFAELVRNALRIYEHLLDERAQGNKIMVAQNDQLVKELLF